MLRRNLRSNWARRNEDEDNQRSPHFGGRNRRNAFHDDQNRDYYGRENSPTEWRRTGNQGNGPDNNFMRQLNTENQSIKFAFTVLSLWELFTCEPIFQ